VSLSDEDVRGEIESWKRFADALRGDDRDLFNEMLRLCYEYAPAMTAKETPVPTEPLLMSLLLMQQKTIVWLIKELKRGHAERDERLAV
jgi:hypothetical protein